MRRRRFLQTTGVGLAGMLAGCNVLGDDTTPTETPTDTPTETATETPTATPEPKPVNVVPPGYMDPLPATHLNGDKHTPNGNFVRIDWDWYLEHYETEMRFGATSESRWNLQANDGNMHQKSPPDYAILRAPVGTTIQQGMILSNIIPGSPNLGPELVRQCGFEMVTESGQSDSAARYAGGESAQVDEIVSYAKPGVTCYIGVDIPDLKRALADNEHRTYEVWPDTVVYKGEDRASGRFFFVSEAWERPILAVGTASETGEWVRGPANRVTGYEEPPSVAALESVEWYLSELVSSTPVVVGQINGGRAQYEGTNYRLPPVRHLEGFDTIMHGFDTNGYTATAQVVTSSVDGEAPTEAELTDVYGPADGQVSTTHRPHVSQLSVTWS